MSNMDNDSEVPNSDSEDERIIIQEAMDTWKNDTAPNILQSTWSMQQSNMSDSDKPDGQVFLNLDTQSLGKLQ